MKKESKSTPVGNDELRREIDQYMVNQQRKFEAGVDQAVNGANRIFESLSSQLLLIGIAVITLSSPLLGNKEMLSSLVLEDKVKLIASWVCIALSIIFGVGQYIVDNRFYSNNATEKNKIVGMISNREFKDLGDMRKKINAAQSDKFKSESSSLPILFQMAFLSLGMFCLLWLMINVLIVK